MHDLKRKRKSFGARVKIFIGFVVLPGREALDVQAQLLAVFREEQETISSRSLTFEYFYG